MNTLHLVLYIWIYSNIDVYSMNHYRAHICPLAASSKCWMLTSLSSNLRYNGRYINVDARGPFVFGATLCGKEKASYSQTANRVPKPKSFVPPPHEVFCGGYCSKMFLCNSSFFVQNEEGLRGMLMFGNRISHRQWKKLPRTLQHPMIQMQPSWCMCQAEKTFHNPGGIPSGQSYRRPHRTKSWFLRLNYVSWSFDSFDIDYGSLTCKDGEPFFWEASRAQNTTSKLRLQAWRMNYSMTKNRAVNLPAA